MKFVLAVVVSALGLSLTATPTEANAFVPSMPSMPSSSKASSIASATSSAPSSPTHQKKVPTILRMASFLDNLPNPFSDNEAPSTSGSSSSGTVQPRPPSIPPPISNDPEALFLRAKAIVASDLGLRDPSILAPNFTWVGPNVVSTGTLNRDEYIAAGQFFDLRSTFPDLDYRAHDFRLDESSGSGSGNGDELTVRLTSRTVGTFRGELRLRSETLMPNGKRMVCPPEAISMTFDGTSGKLTKLCSGFAMDRLVGNTGGLCGVMAAATVAGSPPSEWEVYPPSVVLGRFFRRSVQQLVEPDQYFLAPFPESVMIQLAKGVLAAENGVKDPDLLSEEFTFCGPTIGPLDKSEFMAEFGEQEEVKAAFPDLEEDYSNFRVDPYDPYRVWYDLKSTGTRTGVLNGKEPDGKRFVGPPEAASMTFDDDGFCTRMTGGAVMDPTDCNTGGLGGTAGILYAAGTAPSEIAVRPLPQIFARLQKGLLSPLTGKNVDDFATVDAGTTNVKPPMPVATPPQQPPPEPLIVERQAIVEPTPPPTPPQPVKQVTPPPPPKVSTPPTLQIPKISLPEIKTPQSQPSKPAVEAKKESTISNEPSDPVTEVFSSFFSSNTASKPAATTPAPPASTNQPSAAEKAKLAKKKEAEDKRKAALAAVEAKRREADEKRKAALAAADEKRRLAEEKKDALKKAEKVLSQAKPRATISLGFFGFGQKPDAKKEEESAKGGGADKTTGAPRGVPTIQDWRQKSDGSITGLIYGSRLFGSGESVTTSPIKGKPAENSVVSTKTGSKYYLGPKSVVGRKGLFGFGGGGNKKSVSPAKPNSRTVLVKKDTSKEDAVAKRKAELEAKNRANAEAAAKRKEEMEASRRAKAEEVARKREELAAAAARQKEEAAARQKGQANAAQQAKAEAEKQAKAEAAARKREQAEAAKQAKAEAAASKREQAEAAKQAKAEAAARKKEEAEAAKQAKAEAAALKREQAEAAKQAKAQAAAEKKQKLEEAKRLKTEALAKKKQELTKKSNAKTTLKQQKSGTISLGDSSESKSPGLFSFGKGEKKPPAGVPVISRWKKNPDGSITGMISGSKAFKEGEKVTTSKLAPGQSVAAGSVVATASGSKYFLK